MQKLGGGTFGDVYLAFDPDLNREVAIKVPRLQALRSGQSLATYEKEAKSLALLRHPGIVAVYDFGTTRDGRCYLVFEFVAGKDLEARIKEGRVPPQEAARWMSEAAAALHAAHKRNLVHRDVKPANILLDAEGHLRVADFGLALHEDEQHQRRGELSGTIAYMAPEQLRGEAHRLDGRADIWSLGVVLYELLTCRRPFLGRTLDEIEDEILHRDPKPLRMIDDAIPTELERITLKCLAKEAKERYSSAKELADDLAELAKPTKPGLNARVAAFLAIATVCLALILGGMLNRGAGTAVEDRPVISVPPAPTPEEMIKALEVIHYRDEQSNSVLVGNMGGKSLGAREGDSVRVQVALAAPAHCYLLAFNTNGLEQLCYPADDTLVPPLISNLQFPPDSLESFYLTDGAGQQAFFIIASPTPLPSYRDWRKSLENLPWEPSDPGVAARFDGVQAKPCIQDRGVIGALKGVDALRRLGAALLQQTSDASLQGLAFPVVPKP